jgi:hypothetical protein
MNAEQQYQEALKADLARQREWEIQQEWQYQEAREADLARQEEWRIEQERQYQYALEEDRARQRLWAEESARQQEQTKNRMGWGTFLIALILSLIADAAELFTGGTIGWFVGLFVDLTLLAMLGFSTAGRKQFKKWIWGPLIEKIPILDAIPFIRAGFLIWSFVSSRSKKLQTISKIASAGLAQKAV